MSGAVAIAKFAVVVATALPPTTGGPDVAHRSLYHATSHCLIRYPDTPPDVDYEIDFRRTHSGWTQDNDFGWKYNCGPNRHRKRRF